MTPLVSGALWRVRTCANSGRAAVEGERVWCVENDLTTLVVRRNGKAAVVGNCAGRLHRDGQNDPVVAYFLVSDIGSDPVMADVLALKRSQSEPMIDPDRPLLKEAPDVSQRVRM